MSESEEPVIGTRNGEVPVGAVETERGPLTQRSIVSAAIALADEDGVGGLTMRKLAQRLGYEVMSLYNHVANKRQLMELMVDAVAGEIDIPSPNVEPLVGIRAMAVASKRAMDVHTWVAPIWLQTMPGANRIDRMEYQLRAFAESGLSPDLAHHGFHAVNNHVIGYAIQQEEIGNGVDDLEAVAREFMENMPADRYPYMIAHVRHHLEGDAEPSFELVLDLILNGLKGLDADR